MKDGGNEINEDFNSHFLNDEDYQINLDSDGEQYKENNDYIFQNKDDSIQRDISYHNSSVASILNSSDLEQSEKGDFVGEMKG